MKLNSHNEWDRLRAVIVGTVDGFSPGLESERNDPSVVAAAREVAKKAYPSWYLDEVAEDLDGLCRIFTQAGIGVIRPRWSEATTDFCTPNWTASGCDIYNVRDLHVVFGDTLVVSASPARFRLFETHAFQTIMYEHFFDDGFRWVSAPVPRLVGQYIHERVEPPTPQQVLEDSLQTRLSDAPKAPFHYLDDDEVLFDAANIIRVGRDVLFLVSSTANRKAATWLARVLGPDYRVHVTHAYRSSHLDSTILPLSDRVVLLNAARLSEATCPAIFAEWDKVYFSDVCPVPQAEVSFHQSVRLPVHKELQSLGVASHLDQISSPWAGLNVLSLDPGTVLVHDQQSALIRALEGKGFCVVPVRMRHCYTMLGGLHCTTLDVVRDSSL
jgi:N-dimethylarginine dimethylaminohydrolase